MSKADDDDDDDDNIVGSPRSNHFAHHTHDRNDESRKKKRDRAFGQSPLAYLMDGRRILKPITILLVRLSTVFLVTLVLTLCINCAIFYRFIYS